MIIASYDEDYTTIDKVIEPVTSPLAKLRLPSGKGEKSYKIMLIDPTNLKPLCSPFGGEFSNYDIVTVISDDIAEVILTSSGYNVEYYTSPTSSRTARIKLSADVYIEYNKEECNTEIDRILLSYDTIINFVDVDGDDVYDKLQAYKYTYDRIANITEDYIRLESGDLYEFDSARTSFEDSDGNEIDRNDFEAEETVAVIIDSAETKCLEVIKLSFASGMIESMHVSGNMKYVGIERTEYPVDENINLYVGDEGIFYIGVTGKIVDYVVPEENLNYAYVLELQFDTSSFEDSLDIKLLTEDGIKIYSVSKNRIDDVEQYFLDNYYAYNIENDACLFNNATDSEKLDSARVVIYDINAKDEITAISTASDRNSLVVDSAVYNAGTNQLGGYTLLDDALVYDISTDRANDTIAHSINSLKDDYKYQGAIVYDLDGERRFLIITGKEAYVGEEDCMAIVTSISETINPEGDIVTMVTYLCDGMEEITYFDDDSIGHGTVNYMELDIGDVFMYIADDNGYALEYAVLAQTDDNGFVDVSDPDFLGEDMSIWTGYIANTTKYHSTSKGEVISFAEGDYVCDYSGQYHINALDMLIPKNSNIYCYDNGGRKPEIYPDAFTPEYAYVDVDAGIAYVAPILLLVDGDNVKETYYFWNTCQIPVVVQ